MSGPNALKIPPYLVNDGSSAQLKTNNLKKEESL